MEKPETIDRINISGMEEAFDAAREKVQQYRKGSTWLYKYASFDEWWAKSGYLTKNFPMNKNTEHGEQEK